MARKLISFDWALKRLLRSKINFGILEGFLSELINEDIKILEVLESESNKENKIDKSNRVDLKVKNSKNEIIIIEVQYEREWHYYQRILYSTSKVITEHIDSGNAYDNVVKVISVNILYFEIGHGKDYVYHGTTNFIGIHSNDELQLTQRQKETLKKDSICQIFPEYYLLKVNNFDDNAKNTLDEWVYFLKNQEIKNNFKAKGLKEAKKKFDIMLLPDNRRKEYEIYLENRRRLKSQFWTAKMEGKIQGKIEGKMEGKMEGLVEGANKEKEKIAFNLLDILDDATIAKKTNLSVEEVEQLRKQKTDNLVKEKPAKYSTKVKTKVSSKKKGKKK